MFLVAYIPPLWFRVMNPRVIAACNGEVRRMHIEPAKKNRLLRQYGLSEEQPAANAA